MQTGQCRCGVITKLALERLLPGVGISVITQSGSVAAFLAAEFTGEVALVRVVGENVSLEVDAFLKSSKAVGTFELLLR